VIIGGKIFLWANHVTASLLTAAVAFIAQTDWGFCMSNCFLRQG
jgi:hypothetical protein